MNNKYNKIKIGDIEKITHKITSEDLKKFVQLTGDDNRLHTDTDFSKKTTYKKPVVHGMLSASFISTVIGTKLPGDGALWFSQSLEFLLPVRIDDEITVIAEVISKNEKEKIIELSTSIFNQDKQQIVSGRAKVKVIEVISEVKTEKKELNKIVLVLGGTGGIGREVVKTLSKDGYKIALQFQKNSEEAYRLKEEIEKNNGEILVIQSDLRNINDVKEITKLIENRLGAITAFVNTVSPRINQNSFLETDWDDFEKHLDLNIKITYYFLKEVLPNMVRNRYGKIVNIVTQAIEQPVIGWSPYITAKAGLSALTKAIALEVAGSGINVNLVSPGMTDTDLISGISEKAKLLTIAKTPLKRIATPSDIAGVIRFLLSNEANHITGETIRVNGGMVMI